MKPQTITQQQFTENSVIPYIPSLQNDLNHHQTLPLPLPHPPPVFNFPMNQREYHMNGFFEAPPPGSSVYNNTANQARFGSNSSSLPCSISMLDEYLFSQVKHHNFCSDSRYGFLLSTWFDICYDVLFIDAATELRESFDEWW